MVYKHAYLNILLLLQSAFMLCGVKLPLKWEVGGCASNSHGNYIVDHGKIMFLNFCGNPEKRYFRERSGSVVECLTRDGRAAGLSLTGATALCP